MNFGGGGFDMGASQFAGGGFMPSQAEGGRGANAYGGGGGSSKKSNVSQTLRALTIRHLLQETTNTDDDKFVVDGQELGTITIVGRVVSVKEEATRAVLVVNDSTASIDVTQWINDGDTDTDAKRAEWQTGRYVRVYGNAKSFQGRKSLNAFAIKRIDDHNEVTHHFLKCVFEHMHLTMGAPPQPGMAQQGGGGMAKPMGAEGMAQPAFNNNAGAYGGAQRNAGGAYGAAPNNSGMSDLHHDVSQLYNTHPPALTHPEGMSVDDACNILRSAGRNYTVQQVMQAAEWLANEGHLYSTTGERHYKTTTSNM